jgi:hypothetical protein
MDPTSQIQWNLSTGSGPPTATCTQTGQYVTFPYGAQWGQMYTDEAHSNTYTCTSTGWNQTNGNGNGCQSGNILANGCTGGTSQATAFNGIVAPGGNANINNEQNPCTPQYGGACNGTTDDTAAVQAAAAAGPLYIPGGVTVLVNSGTIDIGAATGGTHRNGNSLVGNGTISCQPSATQTACVRVQNASITTLGTVSVNCNSLVTYCVEITLGAGSSAETTDVFMPIVSGGQYGIAIGPDTSGDVSHVNIFGTKVASSVVADFVIGNTVQGNVLANNCYGCTADLSGSVGVLIRGGGFSWHGGATDENTGTDFVVGPPDQPVLIEGNRSEGSAQFYQQTCCSAGIPGVTLENDTWFSGATPNACAVQYAAASPLNIINSRFANGNNVSTTNICISPNISYPPVFMEDVGIFNPAWPATLQTMASANPAFFSSGDYQFNPATFAPSAGSGETFTGGALFSNGAGTFAGSLSAGGTVQSVLFSTGPDANYVTHSLFDNGLTGWPAVSTAPTVTLNAGPDVFGGNSALGFATTSTATGNDISQATSLTMSPSNSYQFSAYYSCANGPCVFSAQLNLTDANCKPGSGTFPTSFTLPSGTGPTRKVFSCTPSASEGARPRIVINTSTTVTFTGTLSDAVVCQLTGVGANCAADLITTTAAKTVNGAVAYGIPLIIPVAVPVRAGTWSISASTTAAVTFATAMTAAPTSCSLTPSANAATTGTPFATLLATTGFVVNVPISGTLTGTYACSVNNAN